MPRSNLRLGLRGWLIADQPGNLILYRPLWRKSWVQTIHGASNSTPQLSRSGVVHVLTQSDRTHSSTPGQNVRSRRTIFSLFAGLFSIVIGLMMLESNPAASQNATVSHQNTEVECKKFLDNPNLLIARNLEFTSVPGLQASFSNELIYGGVRSRSVGLNCSEMSETYRLIEVLVDGNWQLKKFAPTG